MAQKLEYEIKGKSDVEQVTNRAKKSVDNLGASFKKAGTDITNRIAGMFAGAVLFDKALNFLTGTFKELGVVADQVERSGLSSDQFQRLAYAAQMTGVSVSVLAKATRQLRVDMAEAAAGTGKKIEMFKALGVTMEQLKGGDATAVFMAISSAMSTGADDSERLLITTALFGDKIGNDIMPMLADFQKLQKDIANAPIVDAKTLKLIGDYNDGVDKFSSALKVLTANLFGAYNAFFKFTSGVSEAASSGVFNLLNKVGLGGAASSAVTTVMPMTPLGFAAVASGVADGSTAATRGPAPVGSDDRAKALLKVIKDGTKTEKDKASDTKATTTASSISGNVIGVGANPVISALEEQTQIAKDQRDYLAIIASRQPQTAPQNITDKGATPSTPATGAA